MGLRLEVCWCRRRADRPVAICVCEGQGGTGRAKRAFGTRHAGQDM